MSKFVRSYPVKNLSKVDTSHYTEGDLFFTKRSVGVLNNNEIIPIGKPDLKDYVKRDEVQSMIDNALNSGGGE